MKRIFVFLALLLLGTHCSKEPAKQTKNPVVSSDLKSDQDYLLIAEASVAVLTKLVSSSVDIRRLDFNDKSAFLKAIGMSHEEYLMLTIKVKAAASRLCGLPLSCRVL